VWRRQGADLYRQRIGCLGLRAGLDACFKQLRRGDVLLVWRLDRLGRSVRHLVTLIDQLQEIGVGLRSVCDGAIDTTTPSGEPIFQVLSALAQFERRLIQERTKAEIAATRARGRKTGPKARPAATTHAPADGQIQEDDHLLAAVRHPLFSIHSATARNFSNGVGKPSTATQSTK
jgi:DNA invertase Pin-like site-specific DNA recombinase